MRSKQIGLCGPSFAQDENRGASLCGHLGDGDAGAVAGMRIEDEEREMISRIFAFSELSARDSLVPLAEMIAIAHDSTVKDAVALIGRHGFSRLPVFESRIDNIVGILHHH